MKSRMILTVALCAMLACVFVPTTLADEGPVGNWKVTVDMAGTPIEADMSVTANDDGTLAGKLVAPMGEAELSNVSYEGNNLSFTQTFGEGDAAMTLTFEGTIDGDTFAGMLNSEMGEMAVTGVRAAPTDPTGDWKVTVDMAGTPIDASMSVTKSEDGTLAGKLVAPMGEAELSDVTFDGTNLAFTQVFGEGDTALTFTFAGTMSGDSFEGMLNSEMGEMAVTGVRAVGSIVGTWSFTSDSQLGIITMPFVVNEDMTATYSEYDVEDLAQDGKNVTFAVTVTVDGSDLPLTFEGEMAGADNVNGAFLMEGSEVATVEIVREAEAQ